MTLPQHLTPGCSERAEGCELAGALGDRDRQRIRDHERADEQRDAPEGEQEGLQERDEAGGVLGVLGRLLARRCGPASRGQDDLRDRRRPVASGTRRAWPRPESGRACPACRTGSAPCSRSNPASVAPPIDDTAPNSTNPEIRICCALAHGPARRCVSPTRETLLLRSAAIDDDLPGLRPGSGHQGERVELRLRRIDAEAEIRRAAEDDRFAVLPIRCASP